VKNFDHMNDMRVKRLFCYMHNNNSCVTRLDSCVLYCNPFLSGTAEN
jgi:hypothetical protein